MKKHLTKAPLVVVMMVVKMMMAVKMMMVVITLELHEVA
jgi:hypothetical protein